MRIFAAAVRIVHGGRRLRLRLGARRGYRPVMRTWIVLLAADGLANCVIAARLGICEDTARKWRRRYWQ